MLNENTQIEKYISPSDTVISGTINVCSTIYTTMCNIEPTSTNIVIAGISISIVTIILSPLIYKWYSKKRDLALNNNIETLIENGNDNYELQVDPANSSGIQEPGLFIEGQGKSISESDSLITENPEIINNFEVQVELISEEDQRIEISLPLTDHTNSLVIQEPGLLIKESITSIPNENEKNNSLITENPEIIEVKVELISENPQTIEISLPLVDPVNSSEIQEPVLFIKAPMLCNKDMEGLLKKIIYKDNMGIEYVNKVDASKTQYEYLSNILSTSAYKTMISEQDYHFYTKHSVNIEKHLKNKSYSKEEIDYILTCLDNYFTSEFAEQKFRLKIAEQSVEDYYLCYVRNRKSNLPEEVAVNNATETWQELYPNISNLNHIKISFNTITPRNINHPNFENIDNILAYIEILKEKVIDSALKNNSSSDIIKKALSYCSNFEESMYQLSIEKLRRELENQTNLENSESTDLQEQVESSLNISGTVDRVIEPGSDLVVNIVDAVISNT